MKFMMGLVLVLGSLYFPLTARAESGIVCQYPKGFVTILYAGTPGSLYFNLGSSAQFQHSPNDIPFAGMKDVKGKVVAGTDDLRSVRLMKFTAAGESCTLDFGDKGFGTGALRDDVKMGCAVRYSSTFYSETVNCQFL